MHWFQQIYWFEQIFWFQLCPFFQCPSIIFSRSYQWWCNCQRQGGLLYITYRLELFVRVQQVALTSGGATARDREASCTSHTAWNYLSESGKPFLPACWVTARDRVASCTSHTAWNYLSESGKLLLPVCGATARDTEASCTSHTAYNYLSESGKSLLPVAGWLPETGRPPVQWTMYINIYLFKQKGQFSQLTWRAALPRAMASIYQTKRKTSEKTTSQSLTQLSLSNLNGFQKWRVAWQAKQLLKRAVGH